MDKFFKTPLDYAYEGKHNDIFEFDKKLTVTLYAHNSKNPTKHKLKADDFEYIMPLGRGAFGEVVLV